METQILNDLTAALNYWGVEINKEKLAEMITDGKFTNSEEFAERILLEKKIDCYLYQENKLVVHLKETGIFSRQLVELNFQVTKENKRRMNFQPGDWVVMSTNRRRKLQRRRKISDRESAYFEEPKQICYVVLGVGDLETQSKKFTRGVIYMFEDYFGTLRNQMVRLANKNEIKKVKMKNLFQKTEQRRV